MRPVRKRFSQDQAVEKHLHKDSSFEATNNLHTQWANERFLRHLTLTKSLIDWPANGPALAIQPKSFGSTKEFGPKCVS